MTIINVCNLFAPIVGPLIGIIHILYSVFCISEEFVVQIMLTKK